MKRLVLLVAVLGFTCLFTGTAFGDILIVPTAEYPTIQAGINAASSGDTVEVAAGTYDENISMKSGVVIQGAGQGISIIDGGESGSVVTATNVDSAAKLDGFTVTNGGNTFSGGGMYNENSSPTVSNCTFSGNSASPLNGASRGGGMYNLNSSPTVTNCTFSGNSAYRGGGMYNDNSSSPTVGSCTFSGNTAASYGGGMGNFYSSSPTVTNCTFSGNSAGYGSGMANFNSSPTVKSCTFSANTADIEGGGMYNVIYSSTTVTDSTFLGNYADYGAGMYNDNSSPTVKSCIFSGNSADYNGGGMYNDNSSSPTVGSCTFSGNTTAFYGGGMGNFSSSSPTVTNSILWGDSPEAIYNYNNSFPSVTYSDIHGGYTGTGNINADPLFVDRDGQDNILGNEDDDLHLAGDSPCIDTGTSSGAPDTDLEGNPRPQGAGYDMGAYEFPSAKPVTMPGIPLLLLDD